MYFIVYFQVMVQGACWTENLELPKYGTQLKKKKESDAVNVCGTVKAAVLTGDNLYRNLAAVYIYDTKPVHFLSFMRESIEWVKKLRKVYDKVSKKKIPVTFLCLNVNDCYNNHMKDIDVHDQI